MIHTHNCPGGTCDDPYTVEHEYPDGSCCAHYGVEDPTFICERCHTRVGYCMGGSEDELCSDCWVDENQDTLTQLSEALIRFTF